MSRSLIAAFRLVLGLAVLGFAGPAAAQPAGFAPDELLVAFRSGVASTDTDTILNTHGAAWVEQLSRLAVHRVRVAPAALDATAASLARHPGVKFVERNYRVALSLTPNDVYYSSEWHLPKIGAPLAWDVTQGSAGVVIAVVDSGVDPTHPDLASKLVAGYNFVSNNTNTADVYGHGTAVAGAAGALGNNGSGVAGVALRNAIMPVVVADSTGYAYYSTIAKGITWAADHGAKVLNLSFGGIAASSTITSAAQYAASKGAVVVAAAGNCGCYESTTENPYVISVGATDQNDALASFSSRGPYVDLSAPGVNVLTTARGGGYMWGNGTSLASPVVAGVVALMMSANPALSPSSVALLVKGNADDLGGAGWDSGFGYGRVNAYRAVAAAVASVATADTMPPTVSIAGLAAGQVVSGPIAVSASAADNTSVARVDLLVDGAFLASDTTAPYAFLWDTTQVVNGTHTLTAKAVDAAGNVGTSTVTVSVSNFADVTAPKAVVTSTRVMDRKLLVAVSATDNVAVAKVDLYVDGKLLGTSSTAPYSFTVNLNSLPGGTHTLQAKAHDKAGNTGGSEIVSFTSSASANKK